MLPILQAAPDLPENVYTTIMTSTDAAVQQLFAVAGTAYGQFSALILTCAAIYVALMGVAVMSGRMYMSPQDAAIRISKLIIVMVVFGSFAAVAEWTYGAFFVVPEGIANYFARLIMPGVGLESTGVTPSGGIYGPGERLALGSFVEEYSNNANTFITEYVNHNTPDRPTFAVFLWILCMAPVMASLIVIVLAKLVMVILLFLLPLIATAALFGRGYSFLGTWVKVLVTLALTVVLTYLAFVLMMNLLGVTIRLLAERGAALDAANNDIYTVGELFPVGVLALITYVLISQIPTIAGSIVGAAGINTQQVGGFMNIAALRSA